MSLANYSDLQASVAAFLDRDDLTTQVPDFILLCEAVMRRRLRGVEKTAELTLDDPYIVLPDIAAGRVRSVVLNTGVQAHDNPLLFITPEQLDEKRTQLTAAGRPRYGTVIDGNLYLAPIPDQSYAAVLRYDIMLLPLFDYLSNDVLRLAPDIYLYGTLIEASAYLEHDERIPMWQARFDRAVDEWNLARERDETYASLKPARLPRVFG